MKKTLLYMCALLLAVACTRPDEPEVPGGNKNDTTNVTPTNPEDTTVTPFDPQDTTATPDPSDIIDTIIPPVTADDLDFEVRSAITVVYSGSSAVVSGSVDSVEATVTGGEVVIRSAAKGLQIIASGNGTGSLKIYSEKKYQLLLQSLTLESTSGPAINNQGKKSLYLSLDGSSTLSDRSGYSNQNADGEDQKACLFSEGQIYVQGSGSLDVTGKNNHAIASDDYIIVNSGTLSLTTTADAAKALKANDYIRQIGGTINVVQSGSRVLEGTDASYCTGLKADSVIVIEGGVLNIQSSANGGRGLNADQGIVITGGEISIRMTGNGVSGSSSGGGGGRPGGGPGGGGWGGDSGSTSSTSTYTNPAIKTDGYVIVSGGHIALNTTGTRGFGIRAEGTITISGGVMNVQTTGSAAEGIESKTQIDMTGGCVYASSQNDDAINCAGPINFSGAWVYAISNGNDAVDSNYGRTGAIAISGGVVVALSSKGSPEEGLDCDNNRYITISGGYVLSGGAAQGGGGGWGGSSSSSSESVGSATQGYCFTGSYAITNGTYYGIYNSNDELLFTVKALTSVSSNNNSLSLVSAPSLTKNGSNYIKSSKSAPTGCSTGWDGYAWLGGSLSSTSSVKTFTGK